MDKRTILALVLCFLVLIGFQTYQQKFGPQPPATGGTPAERTEPVAPTETATIGPAPAPPAPTQTAAPEPPPPAAGNGGAPLAAEPEPPVRTFFVENDALASDLSSAGAVIESLRLKKFFAEDQKTPLDLLRPFAGPASATALELTLAGSPVPLESASWNAAQQGRAVDFNRSAGPLAVEKTVTMSPDGYHFEVSLRFKNQSAAPAPLTYTLLGAKGLTLDDSSGRSAVSAVVGIESGDSVKMEAIDATSLPKPNAPDDKKKEWNTATYGGAASKYFAVVLIPLTANLHPTFFADQLPEDVIDRATGVKHANVRSGFRVKDLKVPPGETVTHRYLLFAGPKEGAVLERYQTFDGRLTALPTLIDLQSRVPLGEKLANLFLWVLHGFHRLAGSYGVAVILLTILVRVLLHPLNRLSQRSMYKMQKLAPTVNKIREKYKGKKSKEAAQKMNVEIMELYNAHGAHPIWGCLPMLLQFPVFIGLYNSIAYSIELRQTHFLWIKDLSLPDRLIQLPFQLPWPVEGYLNLLPVLMVVTMIVQQKMQPPPPDPQQQQQQQMMSWMLPVFGVLFYTVPSGLVLYFFTSSLLGILEQRWIRHQLQVEERTGKFAV